MLLAALVGAGDQQDRPREVRIGAPRLLPVDQPAAVDLVGAAGQAATSDPASGSDIDTDSESPATTPASTSRFMSSAANFW